MFRNEDEAEEWWDKASVEDRTLFLASGYVKFENDKGEVPPEKLAQIPANKLPDWFWDALLHIQSHRTKTV